MRRPCRSPARRCRQRRLRDSPRPAPPLPRQWPRRHASPPARALRLPAVCRSGPRVRSRTGDPVCGLAASRDEGARQMAHFDAGIRGEPNFARHPNHASFGSKAGEPQTCQARFAWPLRRKRDASRLLSRPGGLPEVRPAGLFFQVREVPTWRVPARSRILISSVGAGLHARMDPE